MAGKCTLNQLALTREQVDGQERYKKIAMDGNKIDCWMVDAFVSAQESAPEEIVLDLDATDDPIHDHQEGRFFHGYYGNYRYLPLYIFSGEHLLCARLRRSNIDGADGAIEELKPHHRPDPAELAGGVDYHPGRLGLFTGMNYWVGARPTRSITWWVWPRTIASSERSLNR